MVKLSRFCAGGRAVGAGVTLALLSAACSGGSSTDIAEPIPTTTMPATTSSALETVTTVVESSDAAADPDASGADEAPAPIESAIPSAMVVDLATSETVDFASIAPADTPILLWMWAPH